MSPDRLCGVPVDIFGEVSPRAPAADAAPAAAVDPSARAAPAPGAGLPAGGAVAPLAVHEEGHRDP